MRVEAERIAELGRAVLWTIELHRLERVHDARAKLVVAHRSREVRRFRVSAARRNEQIDTERAVWRRGTERAVTPLEIVEPLRDGAQKRSLGRRVVGSAADVEANVLDLRARDRCRSAELDVDASSCASVSRDRRVADRGRFEVRAARRRRGRRLRVRSLRSSRSSRATAPSLAHWGVRIADFRTLRVSGSTLHGGSAAMQISRIAASRLEPSHAVIEGSIRS